MGVGHIRRRYFKGSTEMLMRISDKYKKLGGGLESAAFAQQVLGKSFKALVPVLEKGSDGIKEMILEAEKMGLFWRKTIWKPFRSFQKRKKRFSRQWRVFK